MRTNFVFTIFGVVVVLCRALTFPDLFVSTDLVQKMCDAVLLKQEAVVFDVAASVHQNCTKVVEPA